MSQDQPQLPPIFRSARSVSRRTALRGAGIGSLAAFLAACGVKGTSPAASGGSSTPAGGSSTAAPSESTSAGGSESKVLNWSSWPEYLDVDENDPNIHPTLQRFEKETGIKVTYTEDVNDNDQYFAKIQPLLAAGQRITADVFIVTDWMVAKLMRLGYLDEIDHGPIPNLKNLNTELQNVTFDPGRKMSITWQSGFAGIAYNPAITGGPIDSVDRLLTDSKLKGKVTLLTEMRDTMALVLADLGYNASDFTDAQFTEAIAKVQEAVDAGQIRQFMGNEYAQGLVAGDIAACMAWTGDVVQLQADRPDLQYALPAAGYPLWSDNFVIPKGAANKLNAEKLINFYYQPDVAAQVADYVNYISPVHGAKEALVADDPDVANNPLIFPNSAVLGKAQVFMALDEEQETRYSGQFAKLMGA